MKKSNIKKIITTATATALATVTLGGLSNTSHSAQASENVATVNYVEGYGIATWNNVQTNAKVTGHYLPTRSQWLVNNTVTGQNGKTWYLVGNNEYASEQYYDLSNENSKQSLDGTVIINYVPNYSVNVWSSPSESSSVNGRVKHGGEFKVFERQVVNGKTWYNVGFNQWVNGKYAQLNTEKTRGQKVFSDFSKLENMPVKDQNPNSTAPTNNSNNGQTVQMIVPDWKLVFTDDLKPELNIKYGEKVFNTRQEASDYAWNLYRTKSSGSVKWYATTD